MFFVFAISTVAWNQVTTILWNLFFSMIGAGSLIALWYLLVKIDQLRRGLKSDNPGQSVNIFDQLCRYHHLSTGEKHLIQRVVVEENPVQRSRVFLDPDLLNDLAMMEPELTPQIRALSAKLFGDSV